MCAVVKVGVVSAAFCSCRSRVQASTVFGASDHGRRSSFGCFNCGFRHTGRARRESRKFHVLALCKQHSLRQETKEPPESFLQKDVWSPCELCFAGDRRSCKLPLEGGAQGTRIGENRTESISVPAPKTTPAAPIALNSRTCTF